MAAKRRRSLTGRILAPGIRLLMGLRMRARMGLLTLILGLPLICETALILHTLHQQREDAELESLGAPVVAAAFPCVERTLELRGLLSLKESNAGNTEQAETAAREALRAASQNLAAAVRSANLPAVDQEWQVAQALLEPVIAGRVKADRHEAFAQYSRVSDALRHLIRADAEASGLLLDPEGPSFHLMQLVVEPMIPWMDALGQIHAGSTAILSNGDGSIQDQIELRQQLARLSEGLEFADTITGSLERSGEAAPDGLKAAIKNARDYASRTAAMVAADRLDGDLKTHFQSGVQAVADATAAGNAATHRLADILGDRSRRLERQEHIALALCLCGLLVAAYLTMAMLLTVFRNVRELVKAVDQLGEGDFTVRMRLQGSDELASVGLTLESVMARLSTLIADVRNNSVVVTQSGLQLGEEIQNLSQRTESQAASLQQTTASVQEISTGVRRGAEAAEAADTKASRVRERAEAGLTSIAAAVSSMDEIRQRSQRVQEIVGVIEGLAFQTNLLALNAAVEAARAGEQGRGFNVVATEVRALAQRSAQSAREISGLINEAVASVRTGVRQVQDANETFVGIVDGIHAVAQSVSDIRATSATQSHNLDQVAQAVGTIDSLTQENARMVESAFNASATLAQRASLLGDGIGSLRLRQGGADEAMELVKRAQACLHARGRAGLEELTRDAATFADRDMYVFAFDRDGKYHAFAGDAARVGRSVRDVPGVDADKLIADAFAQASHGGGWVDYRYVNPTTGTTDLKTSYVVAFERDLVVGCGVYKMRNI